MHDVSLMLVVGLAHFLSKILIAEGLVCRTEKVWFLAFMGCAGWSGCVDWYIWSGLMKLYLEVVREGEEIMQSCQ